MGAAVRRYNAASLAFSETSTVDPRIEVELAESWQALSPWTRAWICLAPAWRDALHEVRSAWKRGES